MKVQKVNSAPVIGGFAGTVFYNGGPAILVDANATVTDADSPNFASGKLTLTTTLNGQPTDRIAIRNQGVTAVLIGVSGANITFGGVVIGTQTGGLGTTPLAITFNTNATAAAVQLLVRNILWRTGSTSMLTRTITASLTDGDGRTSTLQSKQIT